VPLLILLLLFKFSFLLSCLPMAVSMELVFSIVSYFVNIVIYYHHRRPTNWLVADEPAVRPVSIAELDEYSGVDRAEPTSPRFVVLI
jgi:hypothetical protein